MIKPETSIDDQDSFQYESLRFRVLANDGNRCSGSLGLAIFLRQGMLAWINTLNKFNFKKSSPDKQVDHQLSNLPFEVQSEMTKVIANMMLPNTEELE